jgi:hypothetical protein
MIKSLRIALFAVVALLVSLALFAAEPRYDPSKEITLSGSAMYVATHPSGASWTGVYTIMREGTGEIEVHLAPDAFLLNEGIELKTGDSLKVVGSRVRWNGTDIVLARQITVKDKVIQLREKNGTPRW